MQDDNKSFEIVESREFGHPQFGNLRVMVDQEENSWFLGKEVAEVLGYAKPSNALSTHIELCDTKVLNISNYPKTGQLKDLWVGNDRTNKTLINESGLYSLILGSKLEKARLFKHWVTSEVLPQIRQTGGYIPVSEEDDEKTILSKALLISQRTIEQKDRLIEAQRPMVQFAKALEGSEASIHVGEMAKLLTQNGCEIGRTRLFRWLREHGYIFQNSTEPRQEWVTKGIFEVKATLVGTHHGAKEAITPLITAEGQRYFLELFREKSGK